MQSNRSQHPTVKLSTMSVCFLWTVLDLVPAKGSKADLTPASPMGLGMKWDTISESRNALLRRHSFDHVVPRMQKIGRCHGSRVTETDLYKSEHHESRI